MTDAKNFMKSTPSLPPAPQTHLAAEYERREAVCTEAALSQWSRSRSRPDLDEEARVRGTIEAYKRQAFAFAHLPTAPENRIVEEDALYPAMRAAWEAAESRLPAVQRATGLEGVFCHGFRRGWAAAIASPAPETHVDASEAAELKRINSALNAIRSTCITMERDDRLPIGQETIAELRDAAKLINELVFKGGSIPAPRYHVRMNDDLRKRVMRAIFDPGVTEGFKGDRDLTTWQTDAVMRVLSTTGGSAE